MVTWYWSLLWIGGVGGYGTLTKIMCIFLVDIREIKEVREGTDSKDFERQQLELKKIDQFCFVLFYTSEFKIKTLSVAGWWV